MMIQRWREKIYTTFIGAINDRDEYQKQEIDKELAFAGVGLWYLNMLAMLIMLIIDTMNQTTSVGTIIIFLINIIYSNYVIFKMKKGKLNVTECGTKEEFLEQKNLLKKSSFKAGISWGLQMFVFMCYVFPYLSSEKISISLFDICLWSGGGIVFGLFMYVVSLLNLKKLY
nr:MULTISPECIES: DUF3278 domain-containing protein [Bacillus cereus group]